jgi:hypothetical protein
LETDRDSAAARISLRTESDDDIEEDKLDRKTIEILG